MADWRRQYWDSVLFLCYVTNTEEKKVETLNELLLAYDRDAIQIITSTFTIGEVRRIPVLHARTPTDESKIRTHPVDEAQSARVRTMFRSDQLDMRAVTPRVGEKAADIGNRYPRLLPADCVHIATAIDAGAYVLFTWDGSGKRRRPGEMLRYDGKIDGLAIKEPFVPMGEMFDPPRV